MDRKQHLFKILIPVFYLAAMVLVVFSAWNEQKTVRQGGGSPLYRNLMGKPALIREGFDPEEVRKISAEREIPDNGAWTGFKTTPLWVKNSLLPDLPKRPFLSPKRIDAREYTIIIPVELDDTAMAFLDTHPALIPGIFIDCIGENWEIFFNGMPVCSQMHLNEHRTWRSVYFPIDRTLIVSGINILALRIIGDPSHVKTGLRYNAPNYLEDYSVIEQRQNKLPQSLLCGIFGFTGIYYLVTFLFLRKRSEIFNLYYGICAILLCIYTATRYGLLRHMIPNSDITLSMEFGSLMLLMPFFFMFIENLCRGRVTKPTWVFFAVSIYFTLTQILFPAQYRDDAIVVWNIYASCIQFPYVIIYDIVYLYLFDKKRIKTNDDVSGTIIINIIVGTLTIFFCAAFDILDLSFFHFSYSLFPYSNFVVLIGMHFALASRFSGMYKQLEQSHAGLETAIHERTFELEEQTRIAVKASRAKSEFLATMSHEIRTPLNAVIGLSEIALMDRLPESSRENIEQIHQSGSVLLGIIGDILDISKIEAGSFELSPAQYDTASLLNDMVNLNMVRIASRPIQFVLEINGDFPARLVGDELRVKQILNNLLSNAIKYTEEGTVTLTVTWEKIDGTSSARLSFAVRDTGIGILAKDLPKLFENYSQLEIGANRKIEGTGLGLAITKQIVNMMGGNISVESEYGKGSCFTARIVQALVDENVIGEETAENLRNFRYAAERETEKIVYLSLPDVHVLVVDDNTANINVARGLLAPYEITVDTATSGKEAIEKVKAQKYDLIFMDHMMPEMDGIATAKIIREWEKDVPIVALTANALQGMRDFYLENGFTDYLSKPLYPKALDETIKKCLPQSMLSRPQSKKATPPPLFIPLVEEQRLDMLNHYRETFASSGVAPDSAYYKKFTALIESLNIEDPRLREQAAVLTSAGLKEDAHTIRELLPGFYRELQNRAALKTPHKWSDESEKVRELYFRLNDLIFEGDTEKILELLREVTHD